MSIVLLVHVLAVGLWLGCLATEIAFEKLMARDESARPFVSLLHDRVDRFVEGPAFVVTAITGAILVPGAAWTPTLVLKVALAAAAVLFNIWCLKIVFDRAAAASAGRWDDWAALDHVQHKVGGLVTLLLIAATVVALVRVV